MNDTIINFLNIFINIFKHYVTLYREMNNLFEN